MEHCIGEWWNSQHSYMCYLIYYKGILVQEKLPHETTIGPPQ